MRYLLLFALVGALLGCGPPTSSLGGTTPAGVDLSGIWLLDQSRSDEPPDRKTAMQEAKANEIDGKRNNALSSMLFAAQDFPVISAERLVIEQDADSIGISYGEGLHRDLIWGLQTRAEWRIDAGWDSAHLVVKSLVSHTSATERYQVQSDGSELVVEVTIRSASSREHFKRTYVRQDFGG